MMAGRITLLLLVTGLFAAAWSNDQAPVAGKMATDQPPEKTCPPAAVSLIEMPRHAASLPTPVGLPCGTYTVIDPAGKTFRAVVEGPRNCQGARDVDAEDHYLAESRGSRWHWIRISTTSVDPLPAAELVDVRIDWPRLSEMIRQQIATCERSLHEIASPLLQRLARRQSSSVIPTSAQRPSEKH